MVSHPSDATEEEHTREEVSRVEDREDRLHSQRIVRAILSLLVFVGLTQRNRQ